MPAMSLSMGPLLFHWPSNVQRDFYARIADEAPVDVVYLGEIVCSKRLPFVRDVIEEITERLRRGGKRVVFSTLALITLARERKDSAALVRGSECDIEINDIAALRYLAQGQSFHVGPLVNVYNEGTLNALTSRGARLFCLPPELSIGAVTVLAQHARQLGVGCEVWGFGRIPLAISARCYHARAEGSAKDQCQFVCARDFDGRAVRTVDGRDFLAINGVQTLSHSYCNVVADLENLTRAGVTSVRLSPHDCDMVLIAKAFRDRLDGRIDQEIAMAAVKAASGGVTFSNGFLFGDAGHKFIQPHS